MIKNFLSIISILFFTNLYSQTDTAFWFAPPEITNDNNSNHSDRPVILRLTAFNQSASVVVSQPANGGFTSRNVFVAANSSVAIDLTGQIDFIESKPANQILNTGLFIKSTSFITAYYEESSIFNPEMFVLKGSNALGTNFFIPAQNIMNNWGFYALPPVMPYSSFDIVATEDNTVITITPANDIVGHSAGIPFNITLNKGQVYSAAAIGTNANNHLTGSIISSTKKIAITIKDDSIGGAGYSGCLDLAGDQLIPIELIGTKYITLPGFLNDPISKPTDHLFVLATEDNTSITINGVVRGTINKGQTYHDSSFNQVKYIVTGKPTYALHLSGFGCEVGNAVLPQLECTGSQKVAFTRSNATNLYMNILVPFGYENNFKFNGSTGIITASMFDTVPFSNGLWKYARILVNTSDLPVGSAAIVENTSIEFHLSIIHGDGSGGARYGYFSDFNKLAVTATSNAVNGNICANNDLKFFTTYNNSLGVKFNWNGPNGYTDTVANPILPNIAVNASGLYTLTATKFSCTTVNIPLNITVTPIPKPNLFTNAPICSGENMNINAAYAGATFSWIGPSNFLSTNANNTFKATKNSSGLYKVTTVANNCSSIDSINVVVNETPKAMIDVMINSICLLSSVDIKNANIESGINYNWSLPNKTTSTLTNYHINSMQYSDTGKYVLTAYSAFCTAKDSIMIMAKPTPQVQFLTLSEVCSNVLPYMLTAFETTGIAGNSGIFSGVGVSASGLFSPAIVGDGLTTVRYTYTANNGCSDFKEQTVTVNPAPVITLEKERYVKMGDGIHLDAKIQGNYNLLYWQDATQTLSDKSIANPVATPIKETVYTITVATNKNCISSSSVVVKIITSLNIPNAFSPNNDGKNDKWEVEDKAKLTYLKANIFDRYGKQVKTLFGNKIEWDGMYNGTPLPVATYYYVLNITTANASENISGWIQLLR